MSQSWTFRHPDFHADRRDALENIKRKVPAARKSTSSSHVRNGNSPSPSSSTMDALQNQIDRMTRAQDEMTAHIRNLEVNYQNVLNEMVNFQRNMAQQDGLMQNLIQYFLQLENGGPVSSNSPSSNLGSNNNNSSSLSNSNNGMMGMDSMVLDSLPPSLTQALANALPTPSLTSNAVALLSLQAAVQANSMINGMGGGNSLVAL